MPTWRRRGERLGQQQPVLLDLAQNVQDHYVALDAGNAARERITVPDAAELERRYEEWPASLGVLCLREVVTSDRAAADEVVDAMGEGTPLSELASDFSVDEASAANGGIVGLTEDQPCPTVLELLPVRGPEFMDEVLDLQPGRATQPFELQDGWHVVEVRPFAEVAEPLAAQLETNPGLTLFVGYLLGADVHVDPRYGVGTGPSSASSRCEQATVRGSESSSERGNRWRRAHESSSERGNRWRRASAPSGTVFGTWCTATGSDRGHRSTVHQVTPATVTVVGLGPGSPEHVTIETVRAIDRIPHRFLRTARHPSAGLVPGAVTFDHLYESADRFADVYAAIVEELVAAAGEHGEVLYAVPGSPLVLDARCARCSTTRGCAVTSCRRCRSSTWRGPAWASIPWRRRCGWWTATSSRPLRPEPPAPS